MLVGGRDFTHALARKVAMKFAKEDSSMDVSEERLAQMAQHLLTKAEDAKKTLSLEDMDEVSLEVEDPNAPDNADIIDVTESELLEACEESLADVRAFVARFASRGSIDSVELSGGGLRMRQVRDCVAAGLRSAGVSEISCGEGGEVLDDSGCARR